jgi:hypothetical protein
VEQTMTRGRVRVEHGRKRVRAYLGGELAADTTSLLLLGEANSGQRHRSDRNDCDARHNAAGAGVKTPARSAGPPRCGCEPGPAGGSG